MSEIASIVSILNFLGLGGLGLFIYYIIKSLKERITNLTQLAEEQKITLDAVRERATEMDKLSKSYKDAFSDFQEMGKKLEERRNRVVKDLEDANVSKDQELARLKKIQLEEIELQKKSLERIPELEKKLESAITEISNQMKILSPSTFQINFDIEPKQKYDYSYFENFIQCEYLTKKIDYNLHNFYIFSWLLQNKIKPPKNKGDDDKNNSDSDDANFEVVDE